MTNIAFQTTGRACYQVGVVDTHLADYVGCPTATHRLEGRTGITYGYFVATGREAGREVRVPSWHSRKGVRVLFVPAVLDGTEPVDGWLGL